MQQNSKFCCGRGTLRASKRNFTERRSSDVWRSHCFLRKTQRRKTLKKPYCLLKVVEDIHKGSTQVASRCREEGEAEEEEEIAEKAVEVAEEVVVEAEEVVEEAEEVVEKAEEVAEEAEEVVEEEKEAMEAAMQRRRR